MLRWIKIVEAFRMVHWLVLSVACYAVALHVKTPAVQTLLSACARVSIAAWLGYWIGRAVHDRLRLAGVTDENSRARYEDLRNRIVCCAMIAVAIGL